MQQQKSQVVRITSLAVEDAGTVYGNGGVDELLCHTGQIGLKGTRQKAYRYYNAKDLYRCTGLSLVIHSEVWYRLRIGAVEPEPVKISIAANSFRCKAVVDEGKTVGGPIETQAHFQCIPER